MTSRTGTANASFGRPGLVAGFQAELPKATVGARIWVLLDGERRPYLFGGQLLTDPQPEPIEGTWPDGMPYTVQFPDDDGHFAADLEHPAPLPRVGDLIEYIDERGTARRYRVRDVLHTLQTSAAYHPIVAEGDASPQATAQPEAQAKPERPWGPGLLRAGLPKVFLEAID